MCSALHVMPAKGWQTFSPFNLHLPQLPQFDIRSCLPAHAGAIGSVHLLPIYPSTGDRGFAPVTYQEVDPKFGEHRDAIRTPS